MSTTELSVPSSAMTDGSDYEYRGQATSPSRTKRTAKASDSAPTDNSLRVLFVDDDEFSRSIIGEGLSRTMTVDCASSVAEAIAMIGTFEPHAVVTDLNFGTGPDGGELVNYLVEHCPWVGCVVLSAHSSEFLAVGRPLPDFPGLIYLVKNELAGMQPLVEAVHASIAGAPPMPLLTKKQSGATTASSTVTITRGQAEALRLIADGASNSAIAVILGVSMRSAESLVHRTIAALGLRSDGDVNVRVLAARMWVEGRVEVK